MLHSSNMSMVTRCLCTAVLVFPVGCRKADNPSQETASELRKPTAMEAFELESKCTILAKEVLNENLIGSALTQEVTSHYRPSDNRCYVRLSVHTADLATKRKDFISDEFLKDGQTKELLATRSSKGDQSYGHVFDDSLLKVIKNPFDPSFNDVGHLMDELMRTDRRV